MPATSLEREIKLRFDSADDARAAVARGRLHAPARPAAPGRRAPRHRRRAAAAARAASCASGWRTARAGSPSRDRSSPAIMKLREELETVVGDGEVLLRDLRRARPPRLVPLREVPRGVRARGRHRGDRRDAGRRLRRDRGQRAGHRRDGRGAGPLAVDDYILDSYRGLFLQHREALGLTGVRHGVRRPRWRS